MFRSHPLLARIVIFLVVPLSISIVFANWYFRQSLPRTEAVLSVDKLTHNVTVTRDQNGVPSIAADNEHDVYYTMGYLHAQDRMWQMEIQRRLVQGRLSEILGEKFLQQDIWFRTLNLSNSAAAAMPALSAEAQASLRAYADGVNAWLDGASTLPPEFVALSMRPVRWTPLDSLSVVKLLALNLGGNYGQELERFLAGRLLDSSDLNAVFAGYPANGPTVIQSAGHGDAIAGLQRLHDLKDKIQAQWQIGGRFVGSNAWVVGDRFMANGQPSLANDTHTGLQIPSIWYPVAQKGGRLAVSGMSLVGLPVIVFGQNQQVAWGGTNMMADVQDLYFEQVDGNDRARYRTGSSWKEFDTRIEKFHVKAAFPATLRPALEPVNVQIRTSEHGPIISDVIGAFDMPVALRWVALDKGDTTYESFFRLSYARDWKMFNDALRFHVAPALNIVYMDLSKNIGYVGVGRIPIRAKGNGSVPAPGWRGDYYWKGYIPFDALPRTFNPLKAILFLLIIASLAIIIPISFLTIGRHRQGHNALPQC
ncbi:penicillin acylase family protein [Janthinobacterium lividum]|nr:penicillin acylase family protein [Janthinobacterium lividum]